MLGDKDTTMIELWREQSYPRLSADKRHAFFRWAPEIAPGRQAVWLAANLGKAWTVKIRGYIEAGLHPPWLAGFIDQDLGAGWVERHRR